MFSSVPQGGLAASPYDLPLGSITNRQHPSPAPRVPRQKGAGINGWVRVGLCLLAVLGTTLLAPSIARAQTDPAGDQTVAILGVNSIDNLLEDVDFVGNLVGQPALADQIQPMLAGFTQGIDPSKPLGLIVKQGEAGPAGALCLPVTDLQQLLTMLGMFGVTSAKQENGLQEISAQGQTFFAREADGWALVSMLPQMLEDLPANPGQLIGTLTNRYDVGVRLHVQNIPEQYREMAVAQLQLGLEAGLGEKQAQETDEEFSSRRELATAQVEQLKQVIQELDQVSLGVSLDGENQRLLIDMLYSGVPGSNLAEQLARNSDPQTDFAGFFQPDAAMMLTFASQASDTDIAKMKQSFATAREQIAVAIAGQADDTFTTAEREVFDSAVDDFIAALLATVEEGKMDGGAVLNLSPNSATFLAGGLVGDPSKMEAGLKKLEELAASKNPEFTGIHWNAAEHKDVKFHTLQLPLPEEPAESRQLFGDAVDVAVGIGDKSVFLALGRDCLQALQDVLDESAIQPGKSIAPMELSFALQQIMEVAATFAAAEDQENLRLISEMLANNADGRDHVRVVLQPMSNGARIRIEAEEGVLRAIGMSVMQSQMQAAGAGGAF